MLSKSKRTGAQWFHDFLRWPFGGCVVCVGCVHDLLLSFIGGLFDSDCFEYIICGCMMGLSPL